MSHHVISTILRHDRKVNSYEIALLRALMAATGLQPDEVDRLRERRRTERGGFERSLWLSSTEP